MTSATFPAHRNFDAAYKESRAILRHHGKSYYFSTCLFPKELQRATSALYAFVRLPDEIVDSSPQNTPEEIAATREKLLEFLDEWKTAYATGNARSEVLNFAASVFHEKNVPFEYSEDFLRAMIQDTHQARYENYADLEGYMYGSASCVGLMMSYIIGFSDPIALKYATQLGNAMQLTNFLRDIDEDYQLRGRVYMPQDELEKFGIGDADIAARRFSPRFEAFMQFQIERAHGLYEESNQGIKLLRPEGRFAVAMASTLYRAILGKLEQQGKNPFAKRAATSLGEKLLLMGKARKLARN